MSGVSEVSPRLPAPEPVKPEPVRRPEPAPAHVAQAATAAARQEVEEAVATLAPVLDPLQISLNIRYDEEARTYRVKIIDERTKEVIREIPNQSVLEAARQAARGLFVDQLG